MPDITISEFAQALRGELRAEMRVHRNRMNTQLREFKHEVGEKVTEVGEKIDEHAAGQDRVETQLAALTTAVNQLVSKDAAATAARARRAHAARLAWRTVTSTPGLIAAATSIIGAAAAAIALL